MIKIIFNGFIYKLRQIFLAFEELLKVRYGYNSVIFFEDLIVFFSGIFIGAIIMTYIFSKIFIKTKRIEGEKFGKISVISFFDGGEKTFFINDEGKVFETMRMILILAFSPWFTIKSYRKKDEKRTKIFISIILILGLLLILLAFLSITTISLPECLYNPF